MSSTRRRPKALFCLRKLLRSPEEKTCSRAAEAILRFKMTLVRHRRSGKPVVKPDPRLEGMTDEDIEFARYLFTLPEEQLAAWARSLRKAPRPDEDTGETDGNPVPRNPKQPDLPGGGHELPSRQPPENPLAQGTDGSEASGMISTQPNHLLLDDDVVAGGGVERVLPGAADQHVVPRAATE